jgi:hypothetical protein
VHVNRLPTRADLAAPSPVSTTSSRRSAPRSKSSSTPPQWLVGVIDRIEQQTLDTPQTARQVQTNLLHELHAAHAAHEDLIQKLRGMQSVVIQLGGVPDLRVATVERWSKSLASVFEEEERLLNRTRELVCLGGSGSASDMNKAAGTPERQLAMLQEQLLQCHKQLQETRFAYDQSSADELTTSTTGLYEYSIVLSDIYI